MWGTPCRAAAACEGVRAVLKMNTARLQLAACSWRHGKASVLGCLLSVPNSSGLARAGSARAFFVPPAPGCFVVVGQPQLMPARAAAIIVSIASDAFGWRTRSALAPTLLAAVVAPILDPQVRPSLQPNCCSPAGSRDAGRSGAAPAARRGAARDRLLRACGKRHHAIPGETQIPARRLAGAASATWSPRHQAA
jgi:hypothetical protein